MSKDCDSSLIGERDGRAFGVDELIGFPVVADGRVIAGDTVLSEGDCGVEDVFWGRRAEGELGLSGGDGKALVEAVDERRQECVCLVDSGDGGEAEFDHEAMLEGTPEAFDTALGLGGTGADMVDAELAQDLAELSEGGLFTGEFVVNGKAVLLAGEEDGVAIAVERVWDAVVIEHMAKDVKIADQVLVEAEVKAEDLVGSVVDDAVKGECWAAVFEPCIGTGVTLAKEAFLGHSGTATSAAGGFMGVRVNESCAIEDPANGARGQMDSMVLGEQFGDVLATGSLEGVCHQRDYLVSDIFRNGMNGFAPPVLVGQEGVALNLDSFL